MMFLTALWFLSTHRSLKDKSSDTNFLFMVYKSRNKVTRYKRSEEEIEAMEGLFCSDVSNVFIKHYN